MEALEVRFLLSDLPLAADLPEALPGPALIDRVMHESLDLAAASPWMIKASFGNGVPDGAPVIQNGVTAEIGPADAGRDPYQIVPEVATPHSTRLTAQTLPDAPFVGVVGTLKPGDNVDLFEIPVDPQTASIQLNLKMEQPTSKSAEQFWVFDQSGQVLGGWSLKGARNGLTVDLSLSSPSPDSALYVGIVPSSSVSKVVNYQLWVTRQAGPDHEIGAVIAPDVFRPTMMAPLNPSPIEPRVATPSSALPGKSAGTAPSEPTALSPRLAPPLVATGPLPTWSASASGGSLDEDNLALPVARLGAAMTNLDPLDGPPTSPGLNAVVVARGQGDAGRSEEATPLLALPGLSGFPLLGASLTGGRRRLVALARTIPASISVSDRGESPAAIETSVRGRPESAVAPGVETISPREPLGSGARARVNRHVTIWSGLNLAAALTFGLLLPDVVATLQHVTTSRLAVGAWRLRRRLSVPKPWAPDAV